MTEPSGVPHGAGLAQERTSLAWGRSGLALIVCGAALLRRIAPLATSEHRPVAGILVAVMGSAMFLMSAMYQRRRRSSGDADRASMRLIAYGTATLGAGAMIVALLPV